MVYQFRRKTGRAVLPAGLRYLSLHNRVYMRRFMALSSVFHLNYPATPISRGFTYRLTSAAVSSSATSRS